MASAIGTASSVVSTEWITPEGKQKGKECTWIITETLHGVNDNGDNLKLVRKDAKDQFPVRRTRIREQIHLCSRQIELVQK